MITLKLIPLMSYYKNKKEILKLTSQEITIFCRIINYDFTDTNYLEQALIHPSADNRNYHFERLEFLGDRVLSLIIAEQLLEKHPKSNEGDLAKKHAFLVSRDFCLKVATLLDLHLHAKTALGKQFNNSIHPVHGNCIEALLGAIYLDGNLEPCKKFIGHFWKQISYEKNEPQSNPKVLLQEWAQKKGLSLPVYEIVQNEGTSHQPIFTVKVCVSNYPEQLGKGKNKKDAEQDAARSFMLNNCIN